uniref:H15 domain-containing protein n=1 Tax=Erpetoichthys calabaricus TaxID=27687 RepID=A0A8C4RD85_ERPCA
MANTTKTAPVAPPAKVPKKKTSSKPKTTGFSMSDLIVKAATEALAAGGYDVENNNARVKLKSLVSKGALVQTKGTGASGSLKIRKASGKNARCRQERKAACSEEGPKKVKPAVKPTKSTKKPKAAKPKTDL